MGRRIGEGRDLSGWDPYLDADEKVLWTGRPSTRFKARPLQLVFSAFGVFFLGFSLLWMVIASQASLLFAAFGVPFVLVGFMLAFGHYFWDRYSRSKTAYALSNKRAFIATSTWGRKLKTYPIDKDTVIEFEPGEEASLFFARESFRTEDGPSSRRIGFQWISDGETVYRKLREIQNSMSGR